MFLMECIMEWKVGYSIYNIRKCSQGYNMRVIE